MITEIIYQEQQQAPFSNRIEWVAGVRMTLDNGTTICGHGRGATSEKALERAQASLDRQLSYEEE